MGIKQLRSNKGFTLVEIIVTLSIFAIILTVGGTVYFQGNRMFTTTAVKNTEKSIGDNMYAFMRERLIYATKLQVIDPVNPNQEPENQNAKVFKLNDAKHLELSGEDIYGNDYYSGYTVSYNVDIPKNDEGKYSTDHLSLTVYVKKGDEIVYQTGSTIKNLNLIPQNSSIEIKQATKPPISYPPYDNPVIVFEEDVSSGIVYAPIELRQYAMDVKRQIMEYEKSNPKNKDLLPDWWVDFCKARNTSNYTYCSNDVLREYVLARYYRKDKNILQSTDANSLNEYWPSFSGFEDAVVQKVDEEIKQRIKEYPIGPGGKKPQLLSEYLKNNQDLVLMCYTFATSVNKTLKSTMPGDPDKSIGIPPDDSCYIYVRARPSGGKINGNWESNLIYDFEEGCWYYYFYNGNVTLPDGNSACGFQDIQWTIKGKVPGRDITYEKFYEENGVKPFLGIKDKIHNPSMWIKIENK